MDDLRTGDNEDSKLLARLDERTFQFGKSLDFLAQENREMFKRVMEALDKHSNDDTARFASDNKRLVALENWRWLVLGGAAVLGYLVYLAASFLSK